MSSGEVLFILAFIVLPTAILVSSVWAVIFVRRRPDRVYREPEPANEPVMAARDSSREETAVLPAVPLAASDPDFLEDDEEGPPTTEHDVVVITHDEHAEPEADDWYEVEEPEDEVAAVAEEPDDELIPAESPVLQSTEDLNEVVSTLRDMEHDVAAEAAEHTAPVEEERPEPEEVQVAEPQEEEPLDEEVFSDTSELPVVESAPAQPPPVEPAAQAEQPPAEPAMPVEQPPVNAARPAEGPPAESASRTGSRWRRRKQSAKLLPSDPDAPRARGRSREPQRQVPQISRHMRRREETPQNPPPDAESDPDTTTTSD